MSLKWRFFSYSTGRFQSVFGKASEAEEQALMKMMEFEMGAGPEDELGQLAKRLAHQGVTYQGVPPREAEVIDQILGIAFSQEGLWTELELEEELPDGLDQKDTLELLKHAASSGLTGEYLPVLKVGRRHKMAIGPACHYFLLDRTDVATLGQEARAVLSKPGLAWSSPDVTQRLMEGLVMVCEFVARKQRPLAGVLVQEETPASGILRR